MCNSSSCLKRFEQACSRFELKFQPRNLQAQEASPLCSKVALADSVEDPLEASPLCSKVALADSVEDPLEAPPLCSKVALADSVEGLQGAA